MTEEMRERMDTLDLVLTIIRENGLIVLAIAALMWQVWITVGAQMSESKAWRDVVDSFRTEQRANRDLQMTQSQKWLEEIVAMRESMVRNGDIAKQALEMAKSCSARPGP